MAPGVAQKSIDNGLNITTEQNILSKLVAENAHEVKTCPVEIARAVREKPLRKVIRPKVLKNHESREYLYDRLYDTPCPRNVSKLIIDSITLSVYLNR